MNRRNWLDAWPAAAIVATGLLLSTAAVVAAIAALHPKHGTSSAAVAATLVIAGAAFLVACMAIRHPLPRWIWLWVVGVGLLCRLVLLPAPPLHQTDSKRYLWDGLVWIQGQNPWRFSPAQALKGKTVGLPTELHQLAIRHRRLIQRINHNHLPTIYPPVSEAVFAAAAWLSPANILSLKGMLLAFDAGTAVLIALTLRRLKLPRIWLLVYWWNPIVIDAFALQAHLDAITIFFVMLFFFFLACDRDIPAALALGFAIAAKFWPVVLVLVLARAYIRRPARLAVILVVTLVSTLIALAPMLVTGPAAFKSLSAYTDYWQMNTLVFHLLFRLWRHFTPTWKSAHMAAIATILIIYAGAVPLLLRRADNARKLIGAGLFLTALIFLLSPTNFPWYYTWLVPMLAICPRPSWLLWSCTLGLYHLLFQYPFVVWFEHLPVIILLVLELFIPALSGFLQKVPAAVEANTPSPDIARSGVA